MAAKRKPGGSVRKPLPIAKPKAAVAESPLLKSLRQLAERIRLVDSKIAKRDIAWIRKTAQQLSSATAMLNAKIGELNRKRIEARDKSAGFTIRGEEAALTGKMNSLIMQRNTFAGALDKIRKGMKK